MATSLPANIHISRHPCLKAKLSQFRSSSATARESKALINDIATILGCEAFAEEFSVVRAGQDTSALGHTYETETIGPERISLIPILRSGLGMVDAISSLLPHATPIHHLGLFREPTTLQPVEYYNNLADHVPAMSTTSSSAHAATSPPADRLAVVLDPIIATGGTAAAAIQTLREWGAARVVVLCVLGCAEGVRRVAAEADEPGWTTASGHVAQRGRVQIWVGAVDEHLDQKGMIVPGVGDVGDRLFGTKGK